MAWRQVAVFPQASLACQVRVAISVLLSVVFVTVLITCTVTVLHVSVAMGLSKLHATPVCTVRSGLHVSAGGVVSIKLMVCVDWAVLPHASVAVHVRTKLPVLPHWSLIGPSLCVI